MNCKYHNEKEAKYICSKCSGPICEECQVKIGDKIICKACVEESVFNSKSQIRDNGTKRGFIEEFLYFCFSVVPGAAQMSKGFMKRGIQIMLVFIGAIVLFSYLNVESFIPLIIIPVWFFSFFDSYHIRKSIDIGDFVEDKEAIPYNWIFKYKRYSGIGLLVLGTLGFLNALSYDSSMVLFGVNIGSFLYIMKRCVIPVILIVIGVNIIIKNKDLKENEIEVSSQIEE